MGARLLDSCSFTHQIKLNFLQTEKLAIGHFLSSEDISAGGHLWRINCFPRGNKEENKDYVSIFLELRSNNSVQAIFEAAVMDRDGDLSMSHRKMAAVHVYPPNKGSILNDWGFSCFVERSVLETLYLLNGSFTIVAAVKVVRGNSIEVPPSDIGSHLGLLLDCTDGSDVSFVADGETFPAHRAVLAARSPVFKAQLLGSMAEANMASITLHDIAPTTFRTMLRFMYTDVFPDDDDLGDFPDDMFGHLLAAADRFALDRLKILCAAQLWDDVSVDTVAATLICAETHNCLQLKKKCIDFIAEDKNFKKVVLTDGFVQLAQQFPSILDELRGRRLEHRSNTHVYMLAYGYSTSIMAFLSLASAEQVAHKSLDYLKQLTKLWKEDRSMMKDLVLKLKEGLAT